MGRRETDRCRRRLKKYKTCQSHFRRMEIQVDRQTNFVIKGEPIFWLSFYCWPDAAAAAEMCNFFGRCSQTEHKLNAEMLYFVPSNKLNAALMKRRT